MKKVVNKRTKKIFKIIKFLFKYLILDIYYLKLQRLYKLIVSK